MSLEREMVCRKPGCDTVFTAYSGNAKYCDAHSKKYLNPPHQHHGEIVDRDAPENGTPEHMAGGLNNQRYEKVCKGCEKDFVAKGAGSHARQHCYDCRPKSARYVKKTIVGDRWCQHEGCRKKLDPTAPAHSKYCSKLCRQRASDARKESKHRVEVKAQSLFKTPDTNDRISQERQGQVYERLQNDRLTRQMLLDGKVTATAIAIDMGVSTASVTRAMHAILAEMAIEGERAKWSRSKRTRALFPVETWNEVRGMDPDDPEFEGLVDQLVAAYSVFSRRHFKLEGRRPIIKDFHLKWIRSIIVAAATGGKRLILSPPRHGKSETLVRFVVWFIIMDPNIRIGWFCASRDVAELMLGAVRDIFENNFQLIKDVLPPGELFKPDLKSGKPWSRKELKVVQQSHVGQKSSSLLALGRTSKFLSRDMDIIIVDDLEDYDSCREESQRSYSRNKLAEIGTRKEEHTCEIYIGSRQHPDDIPNHLLGLEDTLLAWETMVDSAHDLECGLDPDDLDIHIDCMLFPEVRSYKYLMEKKMEMEALGLGHLYPMRYLNTPIPADGQVFDMDLIKEHALNRERGLGLEELPLGFLAGGLDPSARGIQASFLWHYRSSDNTQGAKISMVDIDTMQSGGSQGALKIIREWYHVYGLELWYFETNSTQIDWFDNIKRELRTRDCHICGDIHPNIVIKDHNTGPNKKDAELGISSMAPWYHSGAIDLPYGTNESRKKTNMLMRQLELWTTDGVQSKKAKTDIKMASWFPFPYFLSKAKRDHEATLELEAGAYPGYGDYSEAPWGITQYPS